MATQSAANRRYRLRGRLDDRELAFPLAPGSHVVGSDPTCDLVIPASGVSRQHAELISTLAGLRVEDLNSKNGTLRNGEAVRTSAVLTGDRLVFGTVELQVDVVGADDVDLVIDLPTLGTSVVDEASVGDELLGTTSILGGDPVADVWMEAVEAFVASLGGTPHGDLTSALESLRDALKLSGVAVVEQRGDEPLVVVASTGELGPGSPNGPSEHDHPLHRARLIRANTTLGLMLWGQFPGSERSQALLRALLRLIEGHRPRSLQPAAGESKPRSDSGAQSLAFPSSYVVGVSRAMTEVYRQMRSLAASDMPVLISGETGVGKECMAGILHASSRRADAPFVAVNCAAIPAELAEAELFGIEKGVATGVSGRPGKFRAAEGGTLFLDEIGDMAPALQAKLLRALQEREVQPVGGRPRPIDVRILAATNADLEGKIATGAFRRDLFYRLAGFVLEIPPLRECPADIPALVERFLRRVTREIQTEVRGVTFKALRTLSAYPWPGNVRELMHEIRALVYRCPEGQAIDSALLPARLVDAANAAPESEGHLDLESRVRRLEQEMIRQALDEARGVRSRAAKLLGISRNRLARKIQQLGIEDEIRD